MPILTNAKKALRVSQRKAVYNQKVKSEAKTMLDKMKAKPSTELLAKVYSSIDKAVKKNIFHKNKAARLKSQMSQLLVKAS
ncbi:MAG: 30S ribosomal protein S20 [Candidatus Woesebacteria bacterium]|jgi:small subunit ribosomal protein S20